MYDSDLLNHVTPILLIKVAINVDGEMVKICAAENLLIRLIIHASKTPNLSPTATGTHRLDVDYVIYLTNM